MPRYYCDYCDTYLTHDSPSVRKQHNAGYKHKANVRTYYQQFEEQQTQSLIDQRIKEHLGQAAAFQVGATFQQHLAARPRLPILPTPVLPIPGIRPPVLPTPVPGAPGYGVPPMPPQPGMPPVLSSMPPAGSSVPPQMPGIATRPPVNLPTAPGASVPASGAINPAPYQIAAVPTSGAITSHPSSAAGIPNPQGFSAGVPIPTSAAAVATNTSQDGFPYPQNTPEPSQ